METPPTNPGRFKGWVSAAGATTEGILGLVGILISCPFSSTCGGIGTHHLTFGDATTFPALDATSSTLWKRTFTDNRRSVRSVRLCVWYVGLHDELNRGDAQPSRLRAASARPQTHRPGALARSATV